ncbi:molybdopterin cofactor-binding domain-containing protein [Chelativorans xinjiangense]|uniref:molybdopterin cofactor-binding domain-containing protein n=1 Tax=Chelativorans xinjiangense TaxID=2681485 RepID=UPI00135A20B1|nr:molybdopterin cofactor-binding domain-containing protein [Chelativorans xinjiangense]
MSIEVLHPRSAEEALALTAGPPSAFIAGGTALHLQWERDPKAKPARLINLARLDGMREVECGPDEIRIGAMATLGALTRHAVLTESLPLLAAAIRSTAGPAVRNLATIGGNIAGRTGCLLPALLALDASLDLIEPRGPRWVPLAGWLAGTFSETALISGVIIPRNGQPTRWAHRKIGLRATFAPSLIGVAGILDVEGGRIVSARLAVGGGPVPPTRLLAAESMIAGGEITQLDWSSLHAAIREEVVAPDDKVRSGRYRRLVAANALVHGLGGTLPCRHASRTRALGKYAKRTPPALNRHSAGQRWHVRPDGPAKIAGSFPYLTDCLEPDMLVGRILRAGIPHARILVIDTSEAEAIPGVVAVVTHRDVPGRNAFGIVVQDQPAFCFDKIRYVGDAVAAVAAIDEKTAEKALSLIRVDYEPLPAVCDPEKALVGTASLVHASGNLQRQVTLSRGDVEKAFAGAAHVTEATYVTSRQMHGFMETEGGYAFVADDGTLTVAAGGQHGRRDRLQLSRILDMPEERIRVISSPTGGAFGGKDELTVQPALALLALKTGRKVRLKLSRAESVVAGVKRNPMTIRIRTACDRDGMLIANEVDVIADAGAYASLGPGVLETALEHACGPYIVPHVRTQGRLAYTNNGTCGAFRGFGANQMTYAVECQMDRLAAMAGLDPVTIRQRNMRRPQTPGYLGQKVAPTERLSAMLEAAEADPIWGLPQGPSPDGSEIVGIGMAMNYQGNGLGTLPPDPGGGALRLASDGAIEALFGTDEIGQGLLTAIQSAVAQEIGCSRDDVRPVTGDTGSTPESGSTTASRGTYIVWRVARDTAPDFTQKLLAAASGVLRRASPELAIAPGGIVERGSNSGELLMSFRQLAEALPAEELPCSATSFQFPKSDHFQSNARFIFAFGATLARVAVSRITGQTRVLDLHQHTAAGPMLDIAAYLGQIEGGSVQGLGYTLSEDAAMRGGHYLTCNLDTYAMPSIADAPQSMLVTALEELDAGDPFGPRGVGELGIGAVTAAIANAVADAIGYWPEQIPFDPEQILEAMGAGP